MQIVPPSTDSQERTITPHEIHLQPDYNNLCQPCPHETRDLPASSSFPHEKTDTFAFRLAACFFSLASYTQAADRPTFLREQCFDCHSQANTEGNLNLESLELSLTDIANFARWERIYDRVASGEMPPASATPPEPVTKQRFLESLATDLTKAHEQAKGTVLRRLNRREYQNTLNDLFGTNLKLAERLPEDGRAHEFDNIGSALSVSMVQMQRYMDCMQSVLDESIQRTISKPESKVVSASYANTQGAEQWIGKIWRKLEDGAVVFFKNYGYPSGMLREANVQRDGWYRIRVTGYAFQSDRPITFGLGATTFARGLEQPTFGYFEFPPGPPTTIETLAWIPSRYMIEITTYGIHDPNYDLKKVGADAYEGPGLAIQKIEVEGPVVDIFPSRGHQWLFQNIKREEILPRNPADRQRTYYQPKFEIKLDDPKRAIQSTLLRVAQSAFRRPVTEAEVDPFLKLYEQEHDHGASIEEALRTAVTAIFCAPEFLYLQEKPGWLNDFALASRLAYFLTRTTPDDELFQIAAEGKLSRDPQVLLAQTDRLLKHPHFDRFIADFTDAWLNLREIEFTNPDNTLYPEFDPFLQWSMLAESRSFLHRLIQENLSVSQLVKSDFAMLNNRLAEHYEIAGVEGPDLRPVKLPPESLRGGLLGQASILKVSANGTNTSPVVRGIWVTERLLGKSVPPPPPGVPGVEPDIRGASTLRELLDKHRTLDTCRGCHQMIDPPGFALECFDPIGGYRERFRSLGNGDPVQKLAHGQKVRYRLGPNVDASGALVDGRTFKDYREFREMIAADRKTLATAVISKLLTFATGRELGFSDRPEVERLVNVAAKDDYALGTMIRLVVTSATFRSK